MDRINDISCCASSDSKYLKAVVIDEIENDEDVNENTELIQSAVTTTLTTMTDRIKSGISTSTIRIQLSFEVENCVNTRKGFWRKDNITSPYVVVSAVDSDSYGGGKIGKTET